MATELNESTIMGKYEVTSASSELLLSFTLGRMGRSRRVQITTTTGEEFNGTWQFDARYGVIEILTTINNTENVSFSFEFGKRELEDLTSGTAASYNGPNTRGQGRVVILKKL